MTSHNRIQLSIGAARAEGLHRLTKLLAGPIGGKPHPQGPWPQQGLFAYPPPAALEQGEQALTRRADAPRWSAIAQILLVLTVTLFASVSCDGHSFFSPGPESPDRLSYKVAGAAYSFEPLVQGQGGTPSSLFTNTPTITALPMPTAVPDATPSLSFEKRLQAADSLIYQAQMLTGQKKCTEAISLWDRVIEELPTYADAYFWRAWCHLGAVTGYGSVSVHREHAERALADLDRAIALGPATAEQYWNRAYAYFLLIGITEERSVSKQLLEIELENRRQAIAMGLEPPRDELRMPMIYFSLGRCDEELAEVRQMDYLAESERHQLMALASYCSGRLDEALSFIDAALKEYPSESGKWYRALILYYMGRLDDALKQMNEILAASPYYHGYHYYLRALIHYEMKEPDLARADLAFGATQTWQLGGMRPYVLGRLALDSGDRETGIEQLRLAEATLQRIDGPILARVQAELQQLGANPISPTLPARWIVTPIPKTTAIRPSPTPANGTVVPTPPNAIAVHPGIGTKKVSFKPGDNRVYRFDPQGDMGIKTVQSLVFRLVSAKTGEPTPLLLSLWDIETGSWSKVDVKWGDNPIPNPERYVTSRGVIHAEIENPSSQVLDVDNISFSVRFIMRDGQFAAYGLP